MVIQSANQNKSTSVISWIGFGLSIVTFLFIWFLNILLFKSSAQDGHLYGELYILGMFAAGILGLMALIFSIIGLSMAIKNNTPIWIGTTGIIICVISILSFIVPIICKVLINSQESEIKTPESVTQTNENIQEDITIQIFRGGRVRCINNINPQGTPVANMNTYDHDFNQQFANWVKMNSVDSSTGVIINSTNDANYSDIIKVVDALNNNDITKYKLSSGLPSSSYYNR